MTCNNNLFSPLADKDPDDPTNHALKDCSSDNVTNTISNQTPAHTEPTTQGNARASQLAPMRPPHPTVKPRILCSGQAIPVSPLITPTQACNKPQHTPTPNAPMPISRAKPTRAAQRKPTTAPTIYPPTKPITSFNTQPSPA
jgi:hypothetical protein